jgi:tetratricopeptide (TPR) repeat protein
MSEFHADPGPAPRWVRRAVLAAACAIVIVILILIARSIGSRLDEWSPDPAAANFNLLVRGFQAGQLNLKKEAPPGMAKLADPYDPVANQAYRAYPYLLHDLSYYGGKLYLYFGVVPAVVLFWPWAAITGRYLFHYQAAVFFCGVGFLASVGILLAAWRRYFPRVGPGVVAACVLALGLADGVPVLLRSPLIYEVTIACAYAMLMLALASVFGALLQPSHRGRWLGAASLFYGLAVGSRPSLLFGAVILAIPVLHAWRAAPERPRLRSAWALAVAAAGPLALICAGLAIYNALRFGNPLEFGQHYQLLVGSYRGAEPTFSLRYLLFNLRVYFLEPLRFEARFPFLRDNAAGPMPAGHAVIEGPFGVLVDVPLTWLALAAPLGCRGRDLESRPALGCFLAVIAVFFGVCAATLGCFWGACSRYEVDFLPSLMLLAVLGVLGLERALAENRTRRLAARWAWGSLLVLSIGFNLLASLQRHAEQYYDHGKMMLALSRYPDAIADFKEALTIKPDYLDARLALAGAHEQAGGEMEAIGELKDILRQNPDSADAENSLGRALSNSGTGGEAIRHLERALRLNPGFADAESNLGFALVGVGREQEAAAHFERALRLRFDRGAANGSPDPSHAYEDGEMMLALGRYPEAIADFTKALEVKPDYLEARLELAYAHDQGGETAEAIVELRDILRRNPDNADAENRLGRSLSNSGRREEGIRHLERALRLKPDFADAENNLGFALVGADRDPEAVAHFEGALRLRPDFWEAHNNLGFVLARMGRTKEAIIQFEQTLELRPDFPDASAALRRLKAAAGANLP